MDKSTVRSEVFFTVIKNKLLKKRLDMGYKKQKDFAQFLDIAQYQYNRYENNIVQPSIEVAYKIAKKIGSTMDELFYEESI